MSRTNTTWKMTMEHVELIQMVTFITDDVPDVVFKLGGLTMPLVPNIWLSS